MKANRVIPAVTILVLVGMFGAYAGFWPAPLFHNASPSVPLGWYRWSHGPPAARGEFVVLRSPPHFRLPWLMKRVKGVAGDRYCWDEVAGTHLLAGVAMRPPDPAAAARGIPTWKGCVTLGPGEIVGYGDTPDSYDSRFLGPIREADLYGIYVPLDP